MFRRRDLLKAAGGLFLVGTIQGRHRHFRMAMPAGPIPGGTLDPRSIPKFQMPLLIPPAMPRSADIDLGGGQKADYYEIAVRQFTQRILPGPFPMTTVWGYGSIAAPSSFSFPA